MICGCACEDFITIDYLATPFCEIALNYDIPEVKLFKCTNCGSVVSEAQERLSPEKLGSLMGQTHTFWEKLKTRIYADGIKFPIGTAPHLQVATLVQLLLKNGLAQADNILDYAAGYGHLSKILKKYFAVRINNYEPFAASASEVYLCRENLENVTLLINCAMFQCLANLRPFEDMRSLLAENGVLLLQTVAAGNITPELTRHIFYTPVCLNMPSNCGMEILMKKFGFLSSCYAKNAKSWVFFQQEIDPAIVKNINRELLASELVYSKGFVGYWK